MAGSAAVAGPRAGGDSPTEARAEPGGSVARAVPPTRAPAPLDLQMISAPLAPAALALLSLSAHLVASPPPAQESAGLPTSAAPATGSSEALASAIDAFLTEHHDIGQFSGTVLVADGGEIVYRGARGEANSDWAIPNTPTTKFRLASITKQFTAMLTLLLVEDGLLSLDGKITDYLPDYPAASGDRVTLTHLLNHTSGIPSYTSRPGFMVGDGQDAWAVADFVTEFCSDPLEFEPGSQYSYNNSGYFLLGAIAEQVTGETFAENLQQRIFDPLEMHRSGIDDNFAVIPERAVGYSDLLGSRRVASWVHMTTPFAAGAMYSTVDDLWKWERALKAKRLLDGELEQAMFTPGLANYGFGWDIREDDEQRAIHSHGGGMPGVVTQITRVPALDRCVIILTNSDGTSIGAVEGGLFDLLEGRQPAPPRRRGDFAIAATVLENGVEAGMELFATYPDDIREQYVERDINSIGYRLIAQRRIEDAIQIFEFNTAAYPESANVWDSLGEAHALAGNRDLAIANYRKALELDPDSETAGAMLERLAN